jgi:hypothetical protein
MKNLLFLLVAMLAFSCSEDISPANAELKAYTHFKPGSYWVYDVTYINADGNSFPRNPDSLYMSQDTVINGLTYHVMQGKKFGQNYKSLRRDSTDRLLVTHPDSKVIFSLEKNTTYSYPLIVGDDVFGTNYYKLDQQTIDFQIEAGSFQAVAFGGEFIPVQSTGKTYHHYLYYSKNTGVVSERVSVYSGGEFILTLKRYHIEM